MDRQTEGQTGRQIDGKMYRRTGGRTGGQANKRIDVQMDGWTVE
jgi:hypothetical protein